MDDLRNVFDGLLAFDMRRQRERANAELRARIRRIGTECGGCSKWMKSSQCPHEKHDNVTGMSRGPDSGARICSAFSISGNAADLKASLIAELNGSAESGAA